jgi:hypothetical protein
MILKRNKYYYKNSILFITLKLYEKGRWKELIIDDFMPCYKINGHPIFANAKNW